MAHSVDAAAKANALSSSVVLAAKKTGVAGLECWMFLHVFAFRAIFVVTFYIPTGVLSCIWRRSSLRSLPYFSQKRFITKLGELFEGGENM